MCPCGHCSVCNCYLRGDERAWMRDDKAHYRREIAAGGDDRMDRIVADAKREKRS